MERKLLIGGVFESHQVTIRPSRNSLERPFIHTLGKRQNITIDNWRMMMAFPSRGHLYEHIQTSIAHLVVFENQEVISIGTGFAFTGDGAILTAAHVIAGGFPVKPGELNQPNRKILAFFVRQELQLLYQVAVCPFQIQCGGMKPVQLDIAILVPIKKPEITITHLTASIEAPKLGEELYFGGYSDEVEFPFLVDRHVLPGTEGLNVLQGALATGIKERAAGPIIKRGTVGNIIEAYAASGENIVVKQSAFYLDNQIHSGASGGPIVSIDGTVRGIICKRMLTRSRDIEVPATSPDQAPQFLKVDVPAGSTLGVGLEPLLALAIQPQGLAA